MNSKMPSKRKGTPRKLSISPPPKRFLSEDEGWNTDTNINDGNMVTTTLSTTPEKMASVNSIIDVNTTESSDQNATKQQVSEEKKNAEDSVHDITSGKKSSHSVDESPTKYPKERQKIMEEEEVRNDNADETTCKQGPSLLDDTANTPTKTPDLSEHSPDSKYMRSVQEKTPTKKKRSPQAKGRSGKKSSPWKVRLVHSPRRSIKKSVVLSRRTEEGTVGTPQDTPGKADANDRLEQLREELTMLNEESKGITTHMFQGAGSGEKKGRMSASPSPHKKITPRKRTPKKAGNPLVKKRKIIEGETSEEVEKLIMGSPDPDKLQIIESDSELDFCLEEKAKKNNLSAKNVKNILHQVLTNEHVVAMMKNTLSMEDPSEAPYVPKMTRARVKEVMEKGNVPLPLPLSPIKKPQKVRNFLQLSFEDEDDDDEYVPGNESFQESDEDSESVASSQTSDFGSPKSKTPSTPKKQQVTLKPQGESTPKSKNLASEEETPSMPTEIDKLVSIPKPAAQPEGDCLSVSPEMQKASIITEPRFYMETMGPPLELPPKSKLCKGEKTNAEMTEEDTIALRTRSKLPLKDTPLDVIESSFVAPDITPDMYDFEYDDHEWAGFLTGLLKDDDPSMFDAVEDESMDDPEYNFLADEEEVDEEDYRNDQSVRVSKKELNELMDEVFEAYGGWEGLEQDDEKIEEEMKTQGLLQGASCKIDTRLVSKMVQEDGDAGHKKETKRKEKKLDNIPEVTPEEKIQINAQMRKHVQLLAQMFVLSKPLPEFNEVASASRKLLEEIEMFSQNSQVGMLSAFNAYNLADALKVVKKEDEEVTPTSSVTSLKKKRGKRVYEPPPLSCHQMSVFVGNPVFMYPWMVPQCGFFSTEVNTKQKVFFLEAEDNLLALGLHQFSGFTKIAELIRYFILPAKTTEQIKIRIKNLCSSKQGDNIIKKVKVEKMEPVMPTILEILDESKCKPICDLEPSQQPCWIEEYNKMTSNEDTPKPAKKVKKKKRKPDTKSKRKTKDNGNRKLDKKESAQYDTETHEIIENASSSDSDCSTCNSSCGSSCDCISDVELEETKVNLTETSASCAGDEKIDDKNKTAKGTIPPEDSNNKEDDLVLRNSTDVGYSKHKGIEIHYGGNGRNTPKSATTFSLQSLTNSPSQFLSIDKASGSTASTSGQVSSTAPVITTSPSNIGLKSSPIKSHLRPLAPAPTKGTIIILGNPPQTGALISPSKASEAFIASGQSVFGQGSSSQIITVTTPQTVSVTPSQRVSVTTPQTVNVTSPQNVSLTVTQTASCHVSAVSNTVSNSVSSTNDNNVIGNSMGSGSEFQDQTSEMDANDVPITKANVDLNGSKTVITTDPVVTRQDIASNMAESSNEDSHASVDIGVTISMPDTGDSMPGPSIEQKNCNLIENDNNNSVATSEAMEIAGLNNMSPVKKNSSDNILETPSKSAVQIMASVAGFMLTPPKTVLNINEDTLHSPPQSGKFSRLSSQKTARTPQLVSPRYRTIVPKTPEKTPTKNVSPFLKKIQKSPRRKLLQQQARKILPKGFKGFTAPSLSPSKKAAHAITEKIRKGGLSRSLPSILRRSSRLRQLLPKEPAKESFSSQLVPDGDAPEEDEEQDDDLRDAEAASEYDTMESEYVSDENQQDKENQEDASKSKPPKAKKKLTKKRTTQRQANRMIEPQSDGSDDDDESADEDNHLAQLMAASSTIGFNPQKRSRLQMSKKSKAKKRKEMTLAMLVPNLIEADTLKDEKDTAFAQAFLTKVKETLKNDSDTYEKFLRTLYDFEKSQSSPVQLYENIKILLGNFPDLVNDFSGFLLPEQAVECGCFMANKEFEKVRSFLRKLEVCFGRDTSHFQKILKVFSRWQNKGKGNVEELKTTVKPLLKGQTHLLEEFSSFFMDARPPESQMTSFEEVHLSDSGDDEKMGAFEGYEIVELPEEDTDCGTKRCRCDCHQNTQDEKLKKKKKHCASCCPLKIVDGRIYLQMGSKNLRPAQVIFHRPPRHPMGSKNLRQRKFHQPPKAVPLQSTATVSDTDSSHISPERSAGLKTVGELSSITKDGIPPSQVINIDSNIDDGLPSSTVQVLDHTNETEEMEKFTDEKSRTELNTLELPVVDLISRNQMSEEHSLDGADLLKAALKQSGIEPNGNSMDAQSQLTVTSSLTSPIMSSSVTLPSSTVSAFSKVISSPKLSSGIPTKSNSPLHLTSKTQRKVEMKMQRPRKRAKLVTLSTSVQSQLPEPSAFSRVISQNSNQDTNQTTKVKNQPTTAEQTEISDNDNSEKLGAPEKSINAEKAVISSGGDTGRIVMKINLSQNSAVTTLLPHSEDSESSKDSFIWSREEDKMLLETCKTEGPAEETFNKIANQLSNRTARQVQNRFLTLMDIFSDEAALDGDDISTDSNDISL